MTSIYWHIGSTNLCIVEYYLYCILLLFFFLTECAVKLLINVKALTFLYFHGNMQHAMQQQQQHVLYFDVSMIMVFDKIIKIFGAARSVCRLLYMIACAKFFFNVFFQLIPLEFVFVIVSDFFSFIEFLLKHKLL